MKTKVNEIPLVGPKGRKELIKKMNEINESNKNNKSASDKLKVLEDIMGITLDPDIDEKYYKYFTIEATQDGTKVYFRQSSYAANDNIVPLKVEVSTDDGTTWTEVTAAPAEDDVPGATLAELNNGDKVLIRGRNEVYSYHSPEESYGSVIDNCIFLADSPCYVYGNIMSLVGGDDFARLRKVKEYAFEYFFSSYDGEIDQSWVLSKDGENLLLPATILAPRCYAYMFKGCTNLTTTPVLPATTLVIGCYLSMFENCTGLTTAPELPATTLAEGCYGSMFKGCTSLLATPELPATTLEKYCYSSMFEGCTDLATAPKLPAMTLAESCYNSMIKGCTGLTAAPELPATTLAFGCYNSIFKGCTGLTTAPKLPATTLAPSCYAYMFEGCVGLTAAPELYATTLMNNCYYRMFSGCGNLSYIKAMFTTKPGSSYTGDWVENVSNTGTFVKNSAASWNLYGTSAVPTGWTVETASN